MPSTARYLPTRFTWAATASLVAIASMSMSARAAGVTAHVVAGQMVIERASPKLKELLTKWKSVFLHGTYFPDAVLKHMQADPKLSGESEAASHGRVQKYCAAPAGVHHQIWTQYKKDCVATGKTDTEDCERRLAFFFGILTHLITDSPWHGQFIDRSTNGKCDACASPMQSFRDKGENHRWCHPGGKSTWREEGGDVTGGTSGRHMVADGDFDFCLAAALRGRPKNEIVIQNPMLFAPATKQGKTGCPAKTFFDPRNGGECWQCPDGLKRTLHAVDSDKACTSNFGGIETATAEYQRKRNFLKGCPSGEFANASLKHCYSCPDGYQHNPVLPVDKKGVCFRTGREKLAAATFIRKQGICPEGQFFDPRKGGQCWSCPSGYIRSVTPVTSIDACARPGKLKCAGIKPPPGASKSLPGFPIDPNLYLKLSAALKKDGSSVSELVLGQQMALFKALHKAEGMAVTRSAAATPAATICPWIIENAVDGVGGLTDSVVESTRFLEALWNHRAVEGVTVLRLDTYEYAIVDSNRRLLHRNKWRDCSTDGDCGAGSSCVEMKGIGPDSKKTCQRPRECTP
jgi:hypothetical protein